MKRSIQKLLAITLISVLSLGGLTLVSAQDEEVLNILYWQAVSIPQPYLSGGTKDIDAAALVLEPLASFNPDGELVARLAAEIPTLENGDFAEDFMSITWRLRDDIVWSDGTPFTAEDVVFTWEYCTNPETGCATIQFFDGVENVTAVDDFTVQVDFSVPKPFPYNAFVGSQQVILQKAQFEECVGAAAATCTEQNFGPIGTGPYVITNFLVNDVVEYARNENYREEGKPYFDRVVFKGGGDAESAARAVLETGEADYAWNLQISPAVLEAMEAAGNGQVVVAFASSLERIQVNQTNPDPALGDARSVYMGGENAHPFLTDPVVTRAMSMVIDRNIIAENLYGDGGRPACNIVNGPPANVSPNNDECFTFGADFYDEANAMLEEAGYVDTDGDGVRETPDGVPMNVLYQTSTNAVRQSTQALIKQAWETIGIATELRNIDAAVFFGSDPASPDTLQKFYADIEMFTSGTSGPDAESFLARWLCDEAPTPDNNWSGRNTPRVCIPEYDELFEIYSGTGDPEERANLVIQMNDLLIDSGALIPLVFRGTVSAHANSIEGVQINGWDSELWNIADWSRAS